MQTKTIRQSVIFKASPHEVFEALMDAKKHSKFTRLKVVISQRVGGKFAIFGYDIYGKNIEIEKDKKIVQEWRCVLKNWPKNHYSKATFSLEDSGGGTRLSLTHSGVPASCGKLIERGWQEYYWKPMKEMLKKIPPESGLRLKNAK